MAELRRVLGRFDATCIVIGAIIGVGIFFTPKQVTSIAGSGHIAMLAWAIGGLVALLGALSCAELGGMYARSASHYTILRDSYGSFPAFLYVFTTVTISQSGALAIIAIISAINVNIVVVGHAGPLWLQMIQAAILIATLTWANARGVRWGATIQNTTVVAKIAALLLISLLAVALGREAVVLPIAETERTVVLGGMLGIIFAALVPAFFSYGGWMQLLWTTGEVRNPERNVPRAITIGVIIVVVVYLLANWAYLRLLGPTGTATSDAIAADAVGAVWPGLGRRLAAGAVAISAFGVLNAGLLTCPRLVQGMAVHGQFFRVFRGISPRFHTPIPSILLISGMSVLLLIVAGLDNRPVEMLTTGVVFIDALFAALTGAAVIVLRRRMPDRHRPVRVPFYPWVPALFVLCEIGIVLGAYADPGTRKASIIGLAWIGVSALVWWLFFRKPGPLEES
ncbi:MAG: APC family permease [Planctomycetota bacterium]|jgi:APA family basic amino acid/polyamine antiporter